MKTNRCFFRKVFKFQVIVCLMGALSKQKVISAGQRLGKEEEEKIAKLRACSKPLYEFVVCEHFRVDVVGSESHATQFTPESEIVIGGECPVYHGGFTSKLVLDVMPDNKNIPVRILEFTGNSSVMGGQRIIARIPIYRKETVNRCFSPGEDETFYLEREFKARESAIELNILNEKGKVLRTDKAVDYRRFVKE